MENTSCIEINLLRGLEVRRSDGTIVDPCEWRTAKTADLLQLLALSVERPVRVTSLLEKFWPEVEESRARASLRTATSQIRRTLRSYCIERSLGSLILHDAWVDVVAYRRLASEARVALTDGSPESVVALVRQSEELYLEDFHAHQDASTWATEVRESLRTTRQSLLCDAAESSSQLHRMRDAIYFADLAVELDACSERPHRTLMRAYAAFGEIEGALRTFDRLRAVLADELGADPSPQTQEMHMQLLRGDLHLEVPDTPYLHGRVNGRHRASQNR